MFGLPIDSAINRWEIECMFYRDGNIWLIVDDASFCCKH